MAKRADITPELCRQLLRYEPETGKLFWLPRPASMFRDGKQSAQHNCNIWNGRYAGKEAFTHIDNYGYPNGSIFDLHMKAHRVIWAIVHGKWPDADIDHLDGSRGNNRLVNLVDVAHAQNLKNQSIRATNKSGRTGVFWEARRSRWRVDIVVNGKSKFIGYYGDYQQAVNAREAANREHGFSERHGRA